MATYRLKCDRCGKVYDAYNYANCPNCSEPVAYNKGGILQLYRMGSFFGMANGFGLYIDGQPFGYIGNKQTLLIVLSYGTHTIHAALGMNRRCIDMNFILTPEYPICYAKVRIHAGIFANSFEIIPAQPYEMPPIY